MKSESPTSPPQASDGPTPTTLASDTQTGDVWGEIRTRWHENHATWFVVFTMVIFLAGSGTLAWRQRESTRPEFPDASTLIPQPADVVASETVKTLPEQSTEIEVLGASLDAGPVRVAIYTSNESFNDASKAFWKAAINVDDQGIAKVTVPADVPLPGQFAVAAYHDANDDGELNRHPVGIPSERYGFSNDARGMFGPPRYEEAVVDRQGASGTVTVSIR
ncbi:MAG: DUF2141 domain-containing protein [Planctomycetota bacterium]